MNISSTKTEQINRLLNDLADLIGEMSQQDGEIGDAASSLVEDVRVYENERICDALRRAKGSQRQAARLLGINPTTLNYKIKRNGVDISPYCLIKMNKK